MDEQTFVDFESPAVDDHWQPKTDSEAEWAILKIAAAQAKVAHHEAERAKAMAKWNAYVEQAKREALRDTEFFQSKLHGYLLRLLESGTLGTRKSYRLPSARLQLRHVAEKWEPVDKEALRAWAEKTDTMRAIWEPDLDAIRQMCADGVEVPGMAKVRPAGEAFSVMFNTDEKAGA